MAIEPESEQIASSVIKIRKRKDEANDSSIKNEKLSNLQHADLRIVQGKA